MTAATEPDSTTCPQCERHIAEIERLRAELSGLPSHPAPSAGRRWRFLVAVGIVLLASAPSVPLLIGNSLERASVGLEWHVYMIWGAAIGLPWAQWSFVAIFCMLHHGPLWKRALMYVSLSVCNSLAMFLTITLFDPKPYEVVAVGAIAPVLAIAIITPAFVARALRRWTLAHRDAAAIPRPVSLTTYLTLMVILGIVVTVAKSIPWDRIISSEAVAAVYSVLFGGPLAAMSFLHVWLLPKILLTREDHFAPRLQWLWLLLIFTATTAFSVAGFDFVTRQQGVPTVGVWLIAWLVVSIPLAGSMLSTAGYFWLRMLGYRLLSSRLPERPAG